MTAIDIVSESNYSVKTWGLGVKGGVTAQPTAEVKQNFRYLNRPHL